MNPNETGDFKILVVDDDAITRNLLILALKKAGYSVEEATNGEEGLRKYERISPDLVLLDALMPIIDGFECCRQLRELSGAQWPPVLMITFLDDNESIDKAFSAGATDYITKPIHWGSLRQRVKTLLDYGYRVRQQDRQRQWQAIVGQFLAQLTAGVDPVSWQSLVEQALSFTQVDYLAAFDVDQSPVIRFEYAMANGGERNSDPDWPQLTSALEGYLGEATVYGGQVDPSVLNILGGLGWRLEGDRHWAYIKRFASATGRDSLLLAISVHGINDREMLTGDRRSTLDQLSSLLYLATARQGEPG